MKRRDFVKAGAAGLVGKLRGAAPPPQDCYKPAALVGGADPTDIHITQPDLEAKLTRSAAQQGRHPDELVQDVLAQHFDEETRFVAAVKRGDARSAAVSILRMKKWATVSSGFCNPPDENPLVARSRRRLTAH